MIPTRENSQRTVVGTITDLCFGVLDTFYFPLVVESQLVSRGEVRCFSLLDLMLCLLLCCAYSCLGGGKQVTC